MKYYFLYYSKDCGDADQRGLVSPDGSVAEVSSDKGTASKTSSLTSE